MTWSPLLLSHVLAASLGVLLGGVQLWRRPRGDSAHRLLGRVWVGLMLWTAVSSFWIRELADGSFSWLHVLSVVTVFGAVNGIVQARRGNIASHRVAMIATWSGSVIALVFAVVVPSRHIPVYAVTNPGGLIAFVLSLIAGTMLLVMLSSHLGKRPITRDTPDVVASVGDRPARRG